MSGPVIGLDLSLTSSGVVMLHGDGEFRAWTLPSTKPKLKGHDRLVGLGDELRGILEEAKPTLAIVEDLPIGARGAGLTAMSHGVARPLLRRMGIPFGLVVPASLKKSAVNSGRADKAEMREGLPEGLSALLKNSDEVDAYWLAQIGAFHLGWEHRLATTENIKTLKIVD